jgi:hypothetical protein
LLRVLRLRCARAGKTDECKGEEDEQAVGSHREKHIAGAEAQLSYSGEGVPGPRSRPMRFHDFHVRVITFPPRRLPDPHNEQRPA